MAFHSPVSCPSGALRRVSTAMALALAAIVLPVQAQYSAPREQTRLDITITAAGDVNADDKDRAAPIMVRLYELKSEDTFNATDYLSLQNNDKALLGNDLLVREEFIMRPGDVKTVRRKSHPDLSAIGVLAGYRDLPNADWRAVQKVTPAPEAAWYRALVPDNKLKLRIELQAKGVRLTPIE